MISHLCEERPHIFFYGKVGFGHFSIFSLKIYTKILTWKVELWIYIVVQLMKKHYKINFLVV